MLFIKHEYDQEGLASIQPTWSSGRRIPPESGRGGQAMSRAVVQP